MPGHDEEGVVDTYSEADQQDQLGRELRHLEHVAEHADQPDGCAQGGQGRQEGEGHGEDRAEHEQEDDAGQDDPESGAAEGRFVSGLGDLTGHRHLEAGPDGGLGRGHELLGLGGRRCSAPAVSKVTVAKAVVPSALIWVAPRGHRDW